MSPDASREGATDSRAKARLPRRGLRARKRVAEVGRAMSFASMTICLSSSGASSAREEVSERIG